MNPEPLAAPWAVRFLEHGLGRLARYHHHRTEGLEHVPLAGPVIVAVNHSFATYDGFLVARSIFQATGRVGVGLGDDLIFKTPGLRRAAWRAGIRPARPATGEALLAEGHLLYVAPGGMREALRPKDERYAVKWEKRKGFARLSVMTGAPLVLAGCPAGDDLYDVHVNRLTVWAYKKHKLPLAWVTGRWGTPVPRPVTLVHHIAAPLMPPPYNPETLEADVAEFHGRAVATMNDLLSRSAT
jgi:1-acyl-sn-glycerol-3-phosphate acyltransferase